MQIQKGSMLVFCILVGFFGFSWCGRLDAKTPQLRLTMLDATEFTGHIEPSTAHGLIRFRSASSEESKPYTMASVRGIESLDYLNRIIRARVEYETPPNCIRLIDGDSLEADVRNITLDGVEFESPQTDMNFLAAAEVAGVTLQRPTRSLALTRNERRRLRNIPNSMAETPPTHLFYSVAGDVLRGRLVQLDADSLTVDIRSRRQEISRERIATIEPLRESPAKDVSSGSHILVTYSRGCRLSFSSIEVSDDAIIGDHSTFGKCEIQIADLDSILLNQK
ncbi:hypothetical protein [Planctomycetes bacterium CA13]|uniref:hypothetical protein n=1 Tax=Novipirellula herctigrandis TaxID=2527986 RepID=UPI0011B70EEB